MQVSILYAFVAGIISFLSRSCVLPLVPGYMSPCFRASASSNCVPGSPHVTACLRSLLWRFVSGFSGLVFISFGASASAVEPVPAAAQSIDGADCRRSDRSFRPAFSWLAD